MEKHKTKLSWLTALKSMLKAREVRPFQLAIFMGPVLLFFSTVVFLSIVDKPYEGVTFVAFAKAAPIAVIMGAASFLVAGVFRLIQQKFPQSFSFAYYASSPAIGLALLAIRQIFPLGSDRPEVWNYLGNQASFVGFIWLFTFAFSQVVGNAVDRLDAENKRANQALSLLEKQHLALISAQEQVRKEIATSLHDGLQSNLVVLGLQMQRTTAQFPAKYKTLASSFIDEIERLRRVDVQSAIRQLSPNLEGVSVEVAIRELCSKYSPVMKVRIDFDSASAEDSMDPKFKLGIFRIVEQALLNAAKHGQAKNVSITSALSGQTLSLLVVNDGLAPRMPITPGLGLGIIDGWCKSFSGSWSLNRVEESTVLAVTLVRET